MLVEDEELDEVALESSHTIDIETFVPRSEVDGIYLDEDYFIAPTDKVSTEAFAVIREAMTKEDLVGIARVVLYRRERILMLAPRGDGLMATALRYRSEVRDEEDYFDDIPNVKVPADMLDLAVHILKSKKGHFEPDKFEDRYEDALVALIKASTPESRSEVGRGQAEQRRQSDGRPQAQREGRTRYSQERPCPPQSGAPSERGHVAQNASPIIEPASRRVEV